MNLLLDTDVLLWALANDRRIEPVRRMLMSTDNDIYFSAVSLAEVALKASIGRLDAHVEDVRAAALASGFIELPLQGKDMLSLPDVPTVIDDPFDRMLLAQAYATPLQFLTSNDTVASNALYTRLVT